MASENEFLELREQIGRLGPGEQSRLLELVLADNRRRHKELIAEMLAAEAELRRYLESQRNKDNGRSGDDA